MYGFQSRPNSRTLQSVVSGLIVWGLLLLLAYAVH